MENNINANQLEKQIHLNCRRCNRYRSGCGSGQISGGFLWI